MHDVMGKCERVHVQNMEQLHARDCLTEPQATEIIAHTKKYTRVQHRNCISGL